METGVRNTVSAICKTQPFFLILISTMPEFYDPFKIFQMWYVQRIVVYIYI